MSIAVKICGIRDTAALGAAIGAGADWVGFVFFPPSPRALDAAAAASLARTVPPGIGRVGLFVAPEDDAIEAVLREVPLDALQLYAAPERIAAIRARFHVPVWRAVGVASAGDLPAGAEGADRLVIEAKPPVGADRPGGNAARLDWRLLAGWQASTPWLLGGGLDSGNVAEAIAQSGATAVDVSSGVESALGVKSPELIRAFVAAARGDKDGHCEERSDEAIPHGQGIASLRSQ